MSGSRYELIDVGDGRKLESLSGYLIDRPSPAAKNFAPHDRQLWIDADARYDLQNKSWDFRRPWPENLHVDCGTFHMPLRPKPFGHIGVFPEQADNWIWLGSETSGKQNRQNQHRRQALNLFGYTGASTMALVVAGYQVAHVDAARPNVQALRTAAEHNGMPQAPIRYIVDDAAKFTAREVRRGRKYHTVVLDPPAYGHAPGGKAWRIARDVWPLLEDCLALLDPADFRILVSGHSPEVDAGDVEEYLRQSEFLHRADQACGLLLESGRSQLKDKLGRCLDTGFYVRAQSA